MLQALWLFNSLENPSHQSGQFRETTASLKPSVMGLWGFFPWNPHPQPVEKIYQGLHLILLANTNRCRFMGKGVTPTQMLHVWNIYLHGLNLSQMQVTIPYMEHMGHENSSRFILSLWIFRMSKITAAKPQELQWCGYS